MNKNDMWESFLTNNWIELNGKYYTIEAGCYYTYKCMEYNYIDEFGTPMNGKCVFSGTRGECLSYISEKGKGKEKLRFLELNPDFKPNSDFKPINVICGNTLRKAIKNI